VRHALGHVEGLTHDYTQHGTTALFARRHPDRQSPDCVQTAHRQQEFPRVSPRRGRRVSVPLDVHVILDNYGTHKHQKVRAWLARHLRFHLHFTPTYASWLNQVERWFALNTQRAIWGG
jgi:hypothetical protein